MQEKAKTVALFIVSDPKIYPPTINAANLLSEKGFHVVLYGIKYPNSKDKAYLNPNIQVKYLGSHQTGLKNLFQYFFILFKLTKDTIIYKYDWIIAYDPFSVLPAFIAAKISGTKWIYHQHDFWEFPIGIFQKILYKLEYILGSKADWVSFPQEFRANLFKERSGLNKMPLIVYNGPRLKWIDQIEKCNPKIHQMKSEYKHIIIYQGGLSKFFGLDNLIRSIPYCKSRFILILLGKELETGIKMEFIQLATDNDVSDKVYFWDEYVPYDELPQITSFCDIGIAKLTLPDSLAPINDRYLAGASNKLIEYMASGLPIISADSEDNRKFFKEDQIGILCDANSPEKIAIAIDQLLVNDEFRIEISNNNKNQFLGKYNFDFQFNKVYQILAK
jgi:glycosyltransferase involved in cell wall biosynthesis